MIVPNAFLGKAEQPSASDIAAVLGPVTSVWNDFVHWMADAGAPAQEWKSVYVNKYGWTLRLKNRKRNIVYLSPCEGCFRVAFLLSDKAMEAVRHTPFPKTISDLLANAPRYPEGTGVRLIVHSERDLEPIRKIAEIKMAN